MAGSPLYSILTPSQKQLPVGMVGELRFDGGIMVFLLATCFDLRSKGEMFD
jgi:hypothetical protein